MKKAIFAVSLILALSACSFMSSKDKAHLQEAADTVNAVNEIVNSEPAADE